MLIFNIFVLCLNFTDTEVGTFNVSDLSREIIEIVEADSFWCVSALLDSIQDNYTFAQPGIQRRVLQLRHLLSRVDSKDFSRKIWQYIAFLFLIFLEYFFIEQLHDHLENHGVEYLQFAFRWMNNLLMREVPLRATIRLWDTYLVCYYTILMIFSTKDYVLTNTRFKYLNF